MSRAITTGTDTKVEEAERGIDAAVEGFKGFLSKRGSRPETGDASARGQTQQV
jgi:hypothetical protein